MLELVKSKLNLSGLLRPVGAILNDVFSRTRITCSKIDGREKSVKTAMERNLRLAKRIWIRSVPGYHTKQYKRHLEQRFQMQQTILVACKESRMLERMSGRYYKKLRLERFVDPPFTYYQPYLKYVYKISSPASTEQGKFFP